MEWVKKKKEDSEKALREAEDMEILRIRSEFSKKRKQQLPLNKTLLLPHILTSPNDGKKRQKKKMEEDLRASKQLITKIRKVIINYFQVNQKP